MVSFRIRRTVYYVGARMELTKSTCKLKKEVKQKKLLTTTRHNRSRSTICRILHLLPRYPLLKVGEGFLSATFFLYEGVDTCDYLIGFCGHLVSLCGHLVGLCDHLGNLCLVLGA